MSASDHTSKWNPSWLRASAPGAPYPYWVELASFAFVLVATLVHRYVALEQVEIGGDALRVWEFARRIATGSPLPPELNHHQARFGLVLPTIVTQWAFGNQATTYFVGPLALGALLHATVAFVALRTSGLLAASLAVVGLFWFPEMVRPSSQILPELYGPAYTTIAIACALGSVDARSRALRFAFLGATALALFLAYGAKLSYLYFAPGVAAFFVWGEPANGASMHDPSPEPGTSRLGRGLAWLRKKRLFFAACLTTLVVGAILVETLLYALFTEQTSQLAVVEKSHGVSHEATVKKASDLFAIYRQSGALWQSVLGAGAVAGVAVLALARHRSSRLIVLLGCVYLFLFTFVLRKWSPPIPWARPHPRYLLAIAPIVAVVVGTAVEELVRWPFRRKAGGVRRFVEFALLPGLALGALGFVLVEPVGKWWKGVPATHAIARTERTARELSRAFAAGIPLVSETHPPKPLRAAMALYVDPKLLMRDGQMIDFGAGVTNARPKTKKPLYFAAAARIDRLGDRPRINAEVMRRHKQSECLVLLSQRNRFFSIQSRYDSDCPSIEESLDAPRDPEREP